MASPLVEIHGYAIVTDDDRIAGPDGATPLGLRNEADWTYFQGELDKADLVAIGRLAHEANPNLRQRRRLVLSRGAKGLERRADALWWNPREMPWAEVASELLPKGGRVAAPGGQGAFDMFLRIGYRAFHLTRHRGVAAPGGTAVFAACDSGLTAEEVLSGAGLVANVSVKLDASAGVSLTIWRAS
ncbi:MAG TPA: hypothetical protein VEK35_11670 [Roseiarcus sp.]|nr:hypothetical protein [Roseiarcus sp.]